LSEPLWDWFASFCYWEQAVGGPDPHMAVVGHLVQDSSQTDRLWAAGCYIGVYNVPTALELMRRLNPYIIAGSLVTTEDWVWENWKGLAFRRERRAVRSVPKLARFLHEYARWMLGCTHEHWWDATWGSATERYEYAWNSCQRVAGLGRYVALKLLEFLRRYLQAPIELPDLRPKGGWSPRAGLALLYPEDAEKLNGDDRPAHLTLANARAEAAWKELAERDIIVTRYNLQVLLCDFKQCYIGQRQFPGRSQDSELEYEAKIAPYWGSDGSMRQARRELFPSRALGELNGWTHVRKELGHVLRDFGYMWSDLLYDYRATTDLGSPVKWA